MLCKKKWVVFGIICIEFRCIWSPWIPLSSSHGMWEVAFSYSNHNTLLLWMNGKPNRRRIHPYPFCFETSWIVHEIYQQNVKDAWMLRPLQARLYVLKKLWRMLIMLFLWIWNNTNFNMKLIKFSSNMSSFGIKNKGTLLVIMGGIFFKLLLPPKLILLLTLKRILALFWVLKLMCLNLDLYLWHYSWSTIIYDGSPNWFLRVSYSKYTSSRYVVLVQSFTNLIHSLWIFTSITSWMVLYLLSCCIIVMIFFPTIPWFIILL